jgi:hypothetical protein
MHRKEAVTGSSAQIDRIAWMVAFVAPLALSALLLTVKTAPAAEPSPTLTPLAFVEAFETETEEAIELVPEEACFVAEEALEAEELAEADVEEICEEEQPERGPKGEAGSVGSAAAQDECALRGANAHATTKRHKLKLTIGYTTNEPVNVTVEIKLGGTRLASLHRHLGKSGVLRFTKQLAAKQNGKLAVRLKLPSGGVGCPSRRLVLFPR